MSLRQRQPRQQDDAHCKFIRSLPCLVCTDNTSTECAHIRYGDFSIAKPMTGIATKCHDKYTVPLCGVHHREQHEWGDEKRWWEIGTIDPVKVALALYSVSGNYEAGVEIVSACQQRA